jgi:tRNA-splicing ligase RtcB
MASRLLSILTNWLQFVVMKGSKYMVSMNDFSRIEEYIYEVPTSFRKDMQVPARFYADEELLDGVKNDRSLEQLVNTATLPGAVKYALAMPDIHQGYGFPIGGVVATRLPDGVISPGGVGYDINCGVRLLATHLEHEEAIPYLNDLASALYANCPSGVGKGGSIKLKSGELDHLMESGSTWAMKRGLADGSDLERTEENGCIAGADAAKVSPRAKERGKGQVGTLGAGNHFIEIDVIDAVFDESVARRIGLFQGQIAVQIHCGSRGLGHQVCSDYVKRFQKAIGKYGYTLPDRELVCAPLSSPEGQDYLAAMKAAANYAFANRQVLAHHIRSSFEQVLAGKVNNHHIYQIYDIAHNMAKIETHDVDGTMAKVCVHRKGATRAFGPGSAALPSAYRDIGQPVLVPGSMGTASWVLVGTAESMTRTFGSTCHGAGRTMSRKKAKKSVHGAGLRDQLESQGIRVRAGSMSGLAEEAPAAYKDVNRVVDVVHGAGIAKKLARLTPLAVIKG